jgi:hypothetical protein
LGLISAAGGVFGSHERATEILIVVEDGERDILRRGIHLKTVADEQPRIYIVELVVVFAPMCGAVKPVTFMAFEIGNAGKFVLAEIIRFVQWILQVGVAAYGFWRRIFVDAGDALRIDRP